MADRPTDRPTDHATRSVTIGCIYIRSTAMRPSNNKISQRSGDEREPAFLLLCISVLLQRYNSILLHDSFAREDCSE